MIIHVKEEYKEKAKAQLKEWNAQIDLLKAKADNAAADLKISYKEELELLRVKQVAAIDKLKEIESASEGTWDKVKETADKTWDDLKTSISNTMAKFK